MTRLIIECLTCGAAVAGELESHGHAPRGTVRAIVSACAICGEDAPVLEIFRDGNGARLDAPPFRRRAIARGRRSIQRRPKRN
jgi:hypothetical protein